MSKKRPQERCRVNRANAGELPNLVPARCPRCYNRRARWKVADRRHEPAFRDTPGDFEVLLEIAERTGHSAATCIGLDDFASRNSRHQCNCRCNEAHCLLVAMAVQQYLYRTGLQIKLESIGRPVLFQEFLEEHARLRHALAPLPISSAQQGGHVITHGRQATWFAE